MEKTSGGRFGRLGMGVGLGLGKGRSYSRVSSRRGSVYDVMGDFEAERVRERLKVK